MKTHLIGARSISFFFKPARILALTVLILSALVLFATEDAYSKDLTHRLGIGYSNQFSTELPSLAVKYWPNADVGFSTALGVQTEPENSKFGLALRMYKVIFPEDKMNFYMGAGAGLLSTRIAGVNNSGFELSGYCGAEFFFPELDSLGISFEAGVGIVSVSNGVNFRTIADHPLRAGMTFYF